MHGSGIPELMWYLSEKVTVSKINNIETITKEGLKLCRPTFIMIEGYPFYSLPETTNTMIKIYIRLYYGMKVHMLEGFIN